MWASERRANWQSPGSTGTPSGNSEDLFWHRLNQEFDNIALSGHPTERLPHTLNVSFAGRIGAEILHALNGVAASTGSACHSGVVELSPVLKAMRVPPEIGMGAVRFSLGRTTTDREIETVVQNLKVALA
jgi:cysteine desulfurase